MEEAQRPYKTITAQELKQKMDASPPNNQDRSEDYALINVLSPESFEHQHVPMSINIPRGQEDLIEERFDKNKEIIVHCSSPTCQASPNVARELINRGFTNVIEYEGGLSEWLNAGYPMEGQATQE